MFELIVLMWNNCDGVRATLRALHVIIGVKLLVVQAGANLDPFSKLLLF